MSESLDTIVFTRFNILTEYGGYFTLNIPFFCQECGNCCRATSFPAPDQFESLIQSLDINLSLPHNSLRDKDTKDRSLSINSLKHTKPCHFFQNNVCSIYPHRPNYCREWFPRRAINCGALDFHHSMSSALLKDQNYQVGIREVIYLGKNPPSSSTPYPYTPNLENITKELLRGYQSASKEDIAPFWEIFLSFNPIPFQIHIFLTINPSIKALKEK